MKDRLDKIINSPEFLDLVKAIRRRDTIKMQRQIDIFRGLDVSEEDVMMALKVVDDRKKASLQKNS